MVTMTDAERIAAIRERVWQMENVAPTVYNDTDLGWLMLRYVAVEAERDALRDRLESAERRCLGCGHERAWHMPGDCWYEADDGDRVDYCACGSYAE